MKQICIIILFFISTNIFAQKEANNWYFGARAGIDFNSGYPIAKTDGMMYQDEGCSTISNSNGQLLFYTNGIKVWNKNHQIMTNGDSLHGHSSSSQSALIVQKPNSKNSYYIFTVDAEVQENGFEYSEVDMSLSSGLGAVTSTKNVILLNPACEKLTAIRHANNRDIWVIVHQWNSDAFNSYLITPSGIDNNAVISNSGIVIGGNVKNALGYMKVSPNGKKIVVAHNGAYSVQLFDFNASNGKISNPIDLHVDYSANDWGPGGVEFSASGRYLYLTIEHGLEIWQFDLIASNPSQSGQIIGAYSNLSSTPDAIQIAPDGKIYISSYKDYFSLKKDYLGIIANPEGNGNNCQFKENAFCLNGREARIGLPNFMQSYFKNLQINIPDNCHWDSTAINYTGTDYDSLLWNFGDANSGVYNTSTQNNIKHKFSSPGEYLIKLVVYTNNVADTLSRYVYIFKAPVNLGNDTTLCGSNVVVLRTNVNNATFRWQDGSTKSNFIVNQPGTYWVNTSVNGCVYVDSIKVSYTTIPKVELGNNTVICEKNNLQLNATSNYSTYLWQDNDTNAIRPVTSTDFYKVTVTNICGNAMDSIFVKVLPQPVIKLPSDTTFCNEVSVLDVTQNGNYPFHYLWQDYSTSPIYPITSSGLYSVQIMDSTLCQAYHTIYATKSLNPIINFPSDTTTICKGQNLYMDESNNIDCSFLWQDGNSSPFYTISDSGTYKISITNTCSSIADSIIVKLLDCSSFIDVPTAFSPNGDGNNDVLFAVGKNVENIDFLIFNRWGEKVFESKSLTIGWDGTFNGKKVDTGVFMYLISGTSTKDRQTIQKQGNISLIR